MADVERRIERQIRAYLESSNMRFNASPPFITIRFASALVSIEVSPWAGHNLVQLRANVLADFPPADPMELYEEVNRLFRIEGVALGASVPG